MEGDAPLLVFRFTAPPLVPVMTTSLPAAPWDALRKVSFDSWDSRVERRGDANSSVLIAPLQVMSGPLIILYFLSHLARKPARWDRSFFFPRSFSGQRSSDWPPYEMGPRAGGQTRAIEQ